MRILLIGPPGVGKGTQAARLQAKFGARPLASGDIFRAEIRNQTELGQLAKCYIERGELVPDEVTIQMMEAHFRSDQVRECGFILDGFPRTVAQAVALDALLERLSLPIDRVVALKVDDDVVVDRIGGRLSCPNCGEIYHEKTKPPKVDHVCDKCNSGLVVRADDRPETIRERLRVFHENTEPVESYYERKGLMLCVDGGGDPDDVYRYILDGLSG